MKSEVLSRVGDKVVEVLFGPETKGVVADIHEDQEASLTHYLVRTERDEWKHFIFQRSRRPWLKLGGRIQIRTRGSGIVFLPWAVGERDPFKMAELNEGSAKSLGDVLELLDLTDI